MDKFDLAQLVTGLEDDADVLDVGGPELVENVIAQATDAETAAAEEVEEVSEEISETVEQQTELEENAAALEAYADFLDKASAAGGLGKTAAHAVSMGVNDRLSSMSISLSSVMPGIESFGNEADKSESTKSFGEKLRGVIAKIWEAVSNMITKLIEKSAELYQRMKNWSPLIQRKAKALQKAIKALKEDPKGKEIKLSATLARKLYMGADAKVDVDAAVRSTVGMLGSLAVAGSPQGINELKGAVDAVKEMTPEMMKTMMMSSVSGKGTDAVNVDVKVPAGYTLLASSVELPGGKTFAIVAEEADGKVKYGTASAKLRDAHEGASEKLKDGATIAAPAKSELETWVTGVLGIVQHTDKIVAVRQQTNKMVKAIVDKAKEKAKTDKDATDEQKAAARELSSFINAYSRVGAKSLDAMVSYGLGTAAKGILEVSALVLKEAGAKVEEEAKTGEPAAA